MADESRVLTLLERILDSEATLDEACRDCPELLPIVRQRLEQFHRVEKEIAAVFPSRESPGSSTRPHTHKGNGSPPEIPGYNIEAMVGSGGMGVVYRARHLKLNRTVAIKMLLAGGYAGPREVERFKREAEAVAALRHPNIVQVFDAGEHSGFPYFTMELIEGRSLADDLAGVPQPAAKAAASLEALARAVHAAHAGGIVHRDLKPANILLGKDGTLKIADFGLARHFDGSAGPTLTLTGERVGTPSYMAPEQALGTPGAICPSVDIYALGAVLYEMLTGRPPFRAESLVETQRQVIERDPVPPSRLNAKVPRDLETICLKCLQKNPQARYASAGDLAADVERFLRHEPIRARPVRRVERFARWVRRNPTTAAFLIAVVALFGLAIGYVTQEWALASKRQAEKARLTARLESGLQLEQQGRLVEARALLRQLGDGGFEDLRRRIDHAVADLDLAQTLDDIRLNRAMIAGDVLDSKKADHDYREAFATSGLDLDQLPAPVVAKRIADSPIRRPLVAALDDWSICASQSAARNRLLEVARLADPDPEWRDHLRDPAIWTDLAALNRLAETARISEQPVSALFQLSARISAAGGDACALCRRIQQEFPGDFWANYKLANELDKRSNPDAITYYLAALALRPNTLAVYLKLGPIYAFHGRDSEAIEYGLRAVRLEPKSVIAHMTLAGIYLQRDDHETEAIAECQAALELDSTYARALGILGGAYLKQGRFTDAGAAFERYLELTPPDTANHAAAASHAATCKRLASNEFRVPAVLAGIEQPDQPDLCELASICYLKKRYADAVRLYRKAIAADPEIVKDPVEEVRLWAACAAVRAANDMTGTTEHAACGEEQAELISEALKWLEEDLAAWSAILLEGKESDRGALIQKLNRWKNSADLAPIRNPEPLKGLSNEQQAKCRALWLKVDGLVQAAIAAGR